MAQSREDILDEVLRDQVDDQGIPGQINFTSVYRDLNGGAFGVRPRHAERALREGNRQRFALAPGLNVYLAASTTPTYTLLVFAAEHQESGPGLTVDLAWRIYSDGDVTNPAALFADLLAAAGLTVVIGFERGRFIRDAIVPEVGGTIEGMLIERDSDQQADQSVFYYPTESDLRGRWGFAIDRNRYLAEIWAGDGS